MDHEVCLEEQQLQHKDLGLSASGKRIPKEDPLPPP